MHRNKRLSGKSNFELTTFLKANQDFCAKHRSESIAHEYNSRLTDGQERVRPNDVTRLARQFVIHIKGNQVGKEKRFTAPPGTSSTKIIARALLFLIDDGANDKGAVLRDLRTLAGAKDGFTP